MENLAQTIISQYANSQTLISYLNSINAAIDPINMINSFYDSVWNISTANGWGLDVWGRIVGVSRIISIPGGNFLGFSQGSPSAFGFGQAPLFNGDASTSYSLSDSAFRLLILVKALSNISGSSSASYNNILMTLFPGRGNAYISNSSPMQSRLTFEFALQPFEIAILKNSGALSPPTGVNFQIMIVEFPYTFGFAQAGYSAVGFGQGTFFNGYA